MVCFYVYIHTRNDTGEVFYVGKGKGNRAYELGRSKHWHNIANKHGVRVELVESGLQEWYAFELEVALIAYYGRKDLNLGQLVNLTDGGEGPSGFLVSEELRANARANTIAQFADPLQREKAKANTKAQWKDPALREKLIVASARRWANPLEREKISVASKARCMDPTHLAKMSEATKAQFANPTRRAELSRVVKAAWANPELLAKTGAASKARWEDPTFREKLTNLHKARWADPEIRDKLILACKTRSATTEQTKAKMADAQRARWAKKKAEANRKD